MKKQWSGVFAAAMIASAALVGAQGNPPQQNTPPPDIGAPAGIQKPTTPPASQAKPSANTVTITGCVQDTSSLAAAAPAAPAGAGAGQSQSSTKTFYLNNATMAADAGSNRPAVGTSGLTATGYKLEGDTATISPHLNHQVRIVGTVQSSSASATGAANAAAGSTAAAPTLKVESLTMVSAKCEEKK